MTGVANSIVDNLNKNLKLLLHGVFYVNAHLLVGHNGTTLLPPHKLHLNIKYTTLSLTMIIKQPLTARYAKGILWPGCRRRNRRCFRRMLSRGGRVL